MAASTIIRRMNDLSLAGDFPPASEADWRAMVEKALVGAPFDVLRTSLFQELSTQPLYFGQSGATPLNATRGWQIVQPLAGETADEAFKQLADDLRGGADAVSLDFSGAPMFKTSVDLKPLIRDGVAYHVAPPARVADVALLLAAAPRGEGQQAIFGSAGFDPLNSLAMTGERAADHGAIVGDFLDSAFYLRERAPSLVPFVASGAPWHEAGGTAVQELAFTLSAAIHYWRELAKSGMPTGDAARCVGFSIAAASDIFLTIAKFRAIRLLWAAALDAAGEKMQPNLLLLARPSRREITICDPHVNILRGTAAAFGAAIGGATGIELMPFDGEANGATHFSRRLARNTSLILQQESQLSAVADAAAGSAYVEALTRDLASNAWTLLREVEAAGGLGAALESGAVQAKLQQSANEREDAVAKREDKITGVSVFPNLSETPPSTGWAESVEEGLPPIVPLTLALPPCGRGERFAALVEAARSGATLEGLRYASRTVSDIASRSLPPLKRKAEPFEALRRSADVALASVGSRPPVFLAVLGKPDDYRARANWVQGFFAAGGLEVIVPAPGFDSIEALVAAFKRSPSPVACLCSSNKVYAAMPSAANALKEAGALFVYLAGGAQAFKGLNRDNARAIDRLIYEGCNAAALLKEAHRILRVEELSKAAGREALEDGFDIYGDSGDHAN